MSREIPKICQTVFLYKLFSSWYFLVKTKQSTSSRKKTNNSARILHQEKAYSQVEHSVQENEEKANKTEK